MAHTSHRVSYHTFVLSPGDDEPVQDWQQWTRDVLADLEEQQGKDLHWYAVHHSNTEHEHVHVVLAGAGEDRETGWEEAVKLHPLGITIASITETGYQLMPLRLVRVSPRKESLKIQRTRKKRAKE